MNSIQLLNVIWEKSRLNLKSEAAENHLSYAWWFIEPVIHMVCYYAVFELLMQRGGPGFVYFLLVGLVPWLWFARSVSQASNSLVSGRGLISQRPIPKSFFPLVLVVQCALKQLIVLGILLIFLIFSGHQFTKVWLGLFPIYVVQLAFIITVAMVVALLVAFVVDFKFIIPTIIQFMFFCSGIFFSFEKISSEYKDYFLMNPMAGLIQAYRNVLLSNSWPDWSYLACVFVFSMLVLLPMLHIYRRFDTKIARLVNA